MTKVRGIWVAVGALCLLLSSLGRAAVGKHDLAGWSGVDSLPLAPSPGPVLIPRYATDPIWLSASPNPSPSPGGTMTFPTIAAKIVSWPGPTILVPKESFTVTKTATGAEWSVVGTVSGAQGTAQTNVAFVTTNGMISFKINPGTYA